MAGPLPEEKRRRRNAPTIPTTNLPATGRKGRPPKPPAWFELGASGSAWWKWAWRTPQAVAWSPGDLVVVARRASLEDDLATIADIEGLDFLEDILNEEDDRKIRGAITRLASLATGRLAICREIRELDDRLGLTPKAMAALRWKIVEEQPAEQPGAAGQVTNLDDERKRRLIDAS